MTTMSDMGDIDHPSIDRTHVVPLDELPEADLRRALLACLAAPAWAESLIAGRPYHDAARWLAAADVAFASLSDAAVRAALQAHPRIGDSPTGSHPDAESSRREQAQAAAAPERVRAAI